MDREFIIQGEVGQKKKTKYHILTAYTAVVYSLSRVFCDPVDCSSPGSSVCGISQARILEWVPFFSPGDLLNPGIKCASATLAGGFFTTEPPGKPL